MTSLKKLVSGSSKTVPGLPSFFCYFSIFIVCKLDISQEFWSKNPKTRPKIQPTLPAFLPETNFLRFGLMSKGLMLQLILFQVDVANPTLTGVRRIWENIKLTIVHLLPCIGLIALTCAVGALAEYALFDQLAQHAKHC